MKPKLYYLYDGVTMDVVQAGIDKKRFDVREIYLPSGFWRDEKSDNIEEEIAERKKTVPMIICKPDHPEWFETMEGFCEPSRWRGLNYDIDLHTDKVFFDITEKDDVVLLVSDSYKGITTYNSFRKFREKQNFHFHVVILVNLPAKENTERSMLKILPYYNELDSISMFNLTDLTNTEFYPRLWDFSIEVGFSEDAKEASQIIMEDAVSVINTIVFEKLHAYENNMWHYNVKTTEYELLDVSNVDIDFFEKQERTMYESITETVKPVELCDKLRDIRKHFYKQKRIPVRRSLCKGRSHCRGLCHSCESDGRAASMETNIWLNRSTTSYHNEAKIDGIIRFKDETDGKGIRSLVVFDECNLHCEYCINEENVNTLPLINTMFVDTLGDLLAKDAVYHEMTGGGITFGGGEPLLSADFISDFHKKFPKWDIVIETSLNVESWYLRSSDLTEFVSQWIIDIKSMDPEIYKRYTKCDNSNVIENICYLLEKGLNERMICRVPLIPGYNSEEDVEKSIAFIHDLGITNTERFTYVVTK